MVAEPTLLDRVKNVFSTGSDLTQILDKVAEEQALFAQAESPSDLAGRMDQDLASRHSQWKIQKLAPEKPVVNARIRVLLSRPLTWAEKEDLETDWTDVHFRRLNLDNTKFTFHVAPNFEHVWVEGGIGSRILFDILSAVLEEHYVNVFPRAVRTFREYNGE